MKLFLKILNVFFVVLGVIFLILILFGIYFWVADPYGIKPFITGDNQLNISDLGNMDTADVLKRVTPEMSDCIYQKLGTQRSMEIMQGGTPNATDLNKIADCLN